jgi:hypothetical protein
MKSNVERAPRRRRYVDTGDYLGAVERMVRAAGKRTGECDPDQLAQLVAIRDTLDAAIQTAVDGMRESGITWASIGEALGTTRQAALMRYGRKPA